MLGMIEGLLHEPSERLRTIILNLVANDLDQRGISIWRVQRSTLNAQRSTLNCEIGRVIERWTLGVER